MSFTLTLVAQMGAVSEEAMSFLNKEFKCFYDPNPKERGNQGPKRISAYPFGGWFL